MKINRTKILVVVLILVVLMQLFPARAARIELAGLIGGAAYFAIWAALRFSTMHKKRAAAVALEAADAAEYRTYKTELDAIRARHEADRDPEELTSISPAYQSELDALHDKHEAMLTRKFGSR